jgi:hypothetical protein
VRTNLVGQFAYLTRHSRGLHFQGCIILPMHNLAELPTSRLSTSDNTRASNASRGLSSRLSLFLNTNRIGTN